MDIDQLNKFSHEPQGLSPADVRLNAFGKLFTSAGMIAVAIGLCYAFLPSDGDQKGAEAILGVTIPLHLVGTIGVCIGMLQLATGRSWTNNNQFVRILVLLVGVPVFGFGSILAAMNLIRSINAA